MPAPPKSFFEEEACAMTLLEIPTERPREQSTPVLKTERLVLRAPRLVDAKTIARLANDRRIGENTARIPFPYSVADAKKFIEWANETGDEVAFAITLGNETLMGACGIALQEGESPEIGYWLRAKRCGNTLPPPHL